MRKQKLNWTKAMALVMALVILMLPIGGKNVYAKDKSYKNVSGSTVAIEIYLVDGTSRIYDTVNSQWTDHTYSYDCAYATGSGFFVGDEDAAQYIVTNNHVIEDVVDFEAGSALPLRYADDNKQYLEYLVDGSFEIRVHYDEDDYDRAFIECHGDTDTYDLAVLKLNKATDKREPVQLHSVTDDMVGDTVYAVGYPGSADDTTLSNSKWGINDATYTKGSIGRIVNADDSIGLERIQTDAQINHGNSGGPLVLEDGEVVGVNTNSVESSGISNFYAITSNEVMSYLDKNNIPYQTATTGSLVKPVVLIGIAAAVLAVIVVLILVMKRAKNKKSPAGANLYCGNCGSIVSEDEAYCPNCGNPL